MAIAFAKTTYNTDVVAGITDNDSKIVAGLRDSRNVSGKRLLQSTCICHSGCLLIEKIIDADFLAKVRKIINIFKDPKLEGILVKRFQGTTFKNFPDTRFCYARDCYESVYKNLDKSRKVIELEDIEAGETKEILENLYDPSFEEYLN